MLSGFQLSHGEAASCVKFLFKSAVIDSAWKYALAFIATVLFGILNEWLRVYRVYYIRKSSMKRDRLKIHQHGGSLLLLESVVSCLIYGCQMLFAYWLMLVAMLYEISLFIAILLGLMIGNATTTYFMPMHPLDLPDGGAAPCCP